MGDHSHAWTYRKYLQDDALLEDEAAAREGKLGLRKLPEVSCAIYAVGTGTAYPQGTR